MTTPASYPAVRVRYATAGVGTTPALVTTAPSPVAPYASSASIHSPDSRVSRPTNTRGEPVRCGNARTSAAPSRRIVWRSSGYRPAVPRTPSVPNRRGLEESVSGTGNPHLDSWRVDPGDPGLL